MIFYLDPVLDALVGGVLGLLIGSFLNVVVHRLPRMLEQQWNAECASWAQEQGYPMTHGLDGQATFNLSRPRSRCPHCGHAIAWYENIPVASYLLLRGRCSDCAQPIGLRYPAVELACGGLFAWCLAHYGGLTPAALAWCGFSAALLALALIDWDTTLLPDVITLPLLWAGLLCAALQWSGSSLDSAVWGAVGGYLSLWLIYWAFKLATGKEGMGHGDFKLFAALGAWFGWQALVPIIVLACVAGAVVGIALKLRRQLREDGYVPFGPFLAGGGLICLFWGPQAVMATMGW